MEAHTGNAISIIGSYGSGKGTFCAASTSWKHMVRDYDGQIKMFDKKQLHSSILSLETYDCTGKHYEAPVQVLGQKRRARARGALFGQSRYR
ncbi:MAG: hypothetical protein GPOALKHO_000272 [Sodalis sp.]|nr:MAG: hypothetical protein GPOALKHO_000272 [Sodalis sp.]